MLLFHNYYHALKPKDSCEFSLVFFIKNFIIKFKSDVFLEVCYFAFK